MLVSVVSRLVQICTRFPWVVIALVLGCSIAAAAYSASHFAITTDVNKLISSDLPWRQREAAFERQFPAHFQSTLVVVDAPTPELAAAASAGLQQKLQGHPEFFRSAQDLAGSQFFRQNGLLFQPTEQVAQFTKGLATASPLIDTLASDPNLRGLTAALNLGLAGVQQNKLTLDDMRRPMSMAADTVESALAGKPAVFSWQQLLSGEKPTASELRHFILVDPVLDYTELEPGKASSDAIRKAAADLHLADRFHARVRLSGTVPMGDEEFSSVQEGAWTNMMGTVIIVLVILWLALKSKRIILAVFINLFAGLALTAAIGLLMVGALNMISVAFAVLFVGLGVDFAIQYSVKYRAARFECSDLRESLVRAANDIGVPLTLAAAAVAAGFLSFMPTSYLGLSELGQIAGIGMIIAYLTSITLLPALITVMNPEGEPEPVGYASLAPADKFLQRHRIGIVVGTVAVALAGLPLLYWLSFDFDPIHLRNTHTEAVSTYLDVQRDPGIGVNAVNVVEPTLAQAQKTATRLGRLPAVERTMTLANFVPSDQPEKLAAIHELDQAIGQSLREADEGQPPTDQENIEALTKTAARLDRMAGTAQKTTTRPGQTTGAATASSSPGAETARRLANDLRALAKAPEEVRQRTSEAFVVPLKADLQRLSEFLKAQPITVASLPDALKSQWLTKEGKARVQVYPKGNPNDTAVLRTFAQSVLSVYPTATGGPISILESGDTVVRAFVHAGLYALLSIAILLWIVLRRFGDVLLTLVPLLLAGVMTLELCVIVGMPLNFANIIALPLLLGVGVAFKIYYIMAWRSGSTQLLQSSLTRAVIWSALTTATAFGSLCLSSHPGTSSMGELLALSLICTLGAAVLFQPALMGAPREIADEVSADEA
jgi:hopanoid biosynthesis associated RND transporter like protein HpnN